jgi:hypothetical protein
MTASPAEKPVMNIAEVPLADRGNGKSFRVGMGRLAPADYYDGEDA